MARTASPLEGTPVTVVTVVKGVLSYHINENEDGDYTVTPWLSGKFQKSLSATIPAVVVAAIKAAE